MMSHVLKLLFLFLVAAPLISQSFNPCLYNREDVLPCEDHFDTGIVSPGDNQYTIHATRVQGHPRTGMPICIKRKEGELLRDIEDLGSPQVKFIFSPGAEQSPPMNYVNQILVEYNVTCEAGQPAFIMFEALDLEPKNCETKCRDYIEINTGSGGNIEYCGNDLPTDPFIVGTGHFILKLRTSFFTRFPGFRMFVTCVSTEGIDSKTCTDYGGSSQKRATLELVDIAPVQQELRLEEPSVIKPQPRPLTLTTANRKTIDSLADSLFNVALSQARRKISSWPPPSYFQNDPNDIRNPSELNSPRISISTLPPPTLLPPPPPPSFPSPILIDELPRSDSLQPRRKRLSAISGSLSTVRLSSRATLNAVRNKNSCNPIVHSVTTSYLTIAQKLEPEQLESARQEFQQELLRQPQ